MEAAEADPVEIGELGLIGDTRTAALITPSGSIDWLCLPTFDGDPIFGRLIGGDVAGCFRIEPAEETPLGGRQYVPDTTTLETVWATPSGPVTLRDGMVARLDRRFLPDHLLVRRVEVERPTRMRVRFDPRCGRAHTPPTTRRVGDAVRCSWPGIAVALTSTAGAIEPGRDHEILVEPGRPLTFVLSAAASSPVVIASPRTGWDALERDGRAWKQWIDECEVDGLFRDDVARSLLTLTLLSYSPSGAPIAAPTTSLPESIGGGRNWDYRYAWPRDAAITASALVDVGRAHDARAFLWWFVHTTALDRPRVRSLYTLHGTRPPHERSWPEWPGYRCSRPVRIGNEAADQHQLDGYGWVVDSADIVDRVLPLDRSTWRAVAQVADFAAERWSEPDAGIWEMRAEPAHHVHSKLMAWLALDRAREIARRHRTRSTRVDGWRTAATALAADIRVRGFDEARGTYVAVYDRPELDASLLLLPVVGLEEPSSPRVVGTIEAICRELGAGGPLLYRYRRDDGFEGDEGAFLPCSFWLVQALALTDRVDEATAMLEELLALGRPLGLLAEEMDPTTRQQLGNFPQALTHAALLQAIFAIRGVRDRAAGRGPSHTERARSA